MSNVIQFMPKSEMGYADNLRDFIKFSREKLTTFSDIDEWSWEKNVWGGACSFAKHGFKVLSANEHKQEESVWLSKPFRDFAKAFVRYWAATQSNKTATLTQLAVPLRTIEAALVQRNGNSDITKLDQSVLDEAATFLRIYTDSPTARYDSGRRIKMIAHFASDKCFCKKITWESPFPAVRRYNSRLDKESKKKGVSKLPSEAALNAIAELFANDPQDISDKFVTSYCALLLCAPSRVSELEDLHVHCIHEQTDSNGDMQLGLRWHAKKHGGTDIKYIPGAMQDVAREAVSRLTDVFEMGRKLAVWLEKNNGKFYRPKEFISIPDDQPLTKEQYMKLFGSESESLRQRGFNESIRILIKGRHNNSSLHERIVKKGSITFADLDELSMSLLPKDFPYVKKEIGLKYSDALICLRKNELDHVAVRPYELSSSKASDLVRVRLVRHKNRKSIFEKHGYTDIHGSPITINTHQFRHWLNTLAQKGHVGQIDIAKWSGRANIHQNSVYNHMTHSEYLEDVKSSGVMMQFTPLAKVKAKDPNMPVTLADLDAATEGNDKVAHVTEYGFCVHRFEISPCQSCADCLNCSEQVCIKGDTEKLRRLKRQKSILVTQLEKAILADNEGAFNAGRWVEHQKRTIERIDALVGILESDEIADGAIVRLSNECQDTPVKRALGSKLQQHDNRPEGVPFQELRSLLEGK